MYAALMSQPTPAAPRWHQRVGRSLIRWETLLLAVAVWLSVNAVASIYWPYGHLAVIPEHRTWTTLGVSLQSNQALTGTTITLPGEDPVHAASGAAFVAVIFNYTLSAPNGTTGCQLSLKGDDRTWTPDTASGLTIYDLTSGTDMGGTSGDCRSATAGGTSGTFGALFQVPKSALSEIQGVQVTVAQLSSLSITTLFRQSSQTAIMQITVPPLS